MSASAIYNHRTLQPTGSSHGHTRFGDAMEAIKQEYDIVAAELVQARTLRDDYEAKVTSQINELNIIRQALYELEAQHGKVRQRYEDEIGHLRAELHALRQLPGPGIHASGPGVHPPDGYRERNGDRLGDRYGDRERDRERDQRDRDRDRERGGERDAKRLKIKAPAHRFYLEHFSPLLPPVQNPAAQNGHGMPPGAVDSPRARVTGVGAERVLADSPRPHRGAIADHPHLPPPRAVDPHRGAIGPADARREGPAPPDDESPFPAFLDNVDPATVPADLKKEGSDWFAVFNPRVRPRALGDVSLVHTLMHATVVCCVQFSADGRYLATGCNRSAQIYDVKTGNKTCVLVDDSAGSSGDLYIRSVRFSPDGRFLATGAEDRQVRIWDIAKKRICNVFSGHTQEIYSLDFSRDGRRIVSGSGDRTARIWDMDTRSCTILAVDADGAGAPTDAATGDAGVTSVAMSPDSRYVAAGSLDTVVRIWDAATGALVERLRGHRDSVYSVVWTPDGRGVVSGSLDKTLKYWDVSGLAAGAKPKKEAGASGKEAPAGEKVGQCTMNFTGHKDYVLSVAVSHDSQWIVSGSKDRGVQFWDRAGVVQCMLQGHKNSVISIDLNPTGNLLATGSGDNLARICA
ncbi:WD40-repeat-containing domain protein [Mycena capillaripes]|nr:WD40-repeat-containing domain protein [Mycena capillaripes]